MKPLAPVLYAEDTEDDAFLMRRAFTKAQMASPLIVAPNGREAIRYLESFTGHPTPHPGIPCLIMLDMKMPFMTGAEILQWIRQHTEFNHVPVIMFSSSSQSRDIGAAKELGANAYLVKPSSLEDLRNLIEALRPLCTTPHNPTEWFMLPGSIA